MENLDDCIAASLDGTSPAILPFIPYIFQDFEEIGADPETMWQLIVEHIAQRPLWVLDLGCGKGAVALHLATIDGVSVHGIDAMPGFVAHAERRAADMQVSGKCAFELADMRTYISHAKGFDVAILGAVGNVFGSLFNGLTALKNVLNRPGWILLDDAWVPDESKDLYNRCHTKTAFYSQIQAAGFTIVTEDIFDRSKIENSDEALLTAMKKRTAELIQQHPENAGLLRAYMQQQEYETEMLKSLLVTGTWLLHIA